MPNKRGDFFFLKRLAQLPRLTLPERRHRVQTFIFIGRPSTTTRTPWMFGAQPRLVLRWEWLTRLPDMTPLLQTSQYLPMRIVHLLDKNRTELYYHALTRDASLIFPVFACFGSICRARSGNLRLCSRRESTASAESRFAAAPHRARAPRCCSGLMSEAPRALGCG